MICITTFCIARRRVFANICQFSLMLCDTRIHFVLHGEVNLLAYVTRSILPNALCHKETLCIARRRDPANTSHKEHSRQCFVAQRNGEDGSSSLTLCVTMRRVLDDKFCFGEMAR